MDIKKLEYKYFRAIVEHDPEVGKYIGRISNIKNLVTFEAENEEDIEFEFQKAVDDYLEFCKSLGIKRRIKNEPGIAFQVRGQIVRTWPHPRFSGLWQYYFNGEPWFASDEAFEDIRN